MVIGDGEISTTELSGEPANKFGKGAGDPDETSRDRVHNGIAENPQVGLMV